jgi:hypothetical protein
MSNVSDKNYRENQNSHFCSKTVHFFLENRTVYVIKWKNIVEPDRSDENTAHAFGMLDN